MDDDDAAFDASGKPQPLVRKHYTSFNSIRNWLENSVRNTSARRRYLNPLQPHFNYLRCISLYQCCRNLILILCRDVAAPFGNPYDPGDAVCAHFLHSGINRLRPKSPFNAGAWAPDARRLVLGTQAGEFTLWEV
jgi:hypothetical protein